MGVTLKQVHEKVKKVEKRMDDLLSEVKQIHDKLDTIIQIIERCS